MTVAGFVEIVGWAAVACLVWLATLSSVSLPELCFAIAASVACGVLAHACRRALGGSWRLRPGWVLWIFPVVGALFAELVALFRLAMFRPRGGELKTVDLPAEPIETAAGREALATLALCATPGTMVADCDPAEHRMTLHVLVTVGPKVKEAIQR